MFNQHRIVMLITAALVLFVLFCLALGLDRSWNDETQAERNALVFADRNREYGAYRLRTDHGNRMGVALLGAVSLLGVAVTVPAVITHFRPGTRVTGPPKIHVADVVLPPISYPPPPAPKPTTPKVATALPPAKPDPEKQRVVEVVDDPVVPPAPEPDTSQAVATLGGVPGGGKTGPTTDPAGAVGTGPGTDLGRNVWEGFEVQEVPQFPGGEAALGEWVRRNLDLPGDVVGKDVVYVQFTVGLDGNVEDVQAVKGKLIAYRNAAERTVRRMPKWKPARMNGHDVRCRLTLPIRFETR